MIHLFIIDDHPLIIQGVKQIISEHADIELTVEARNGSGVLEKIRTAKIDLVILDIGLKDQSGLDVLKEIRKELPEMKVLMMSMYSSNLLVKQCFDAGASGFVTKESDFENLVPAIRKIMEGQTYVSSQLVPNLVQSMKTPADPTHQQSLSERELQTLRLLGQGKTISEISRELNLSVKTVSTFRARILEKLQLRTTGEIVRYAVENNLT